MKYDDVDDNGYYDVNDFLKMKNEEILKENDNKRWDVCLMNPPYDSKSNLHLKFLKKVNDLSDNIISIQPGIWLEKSRINTPLAEYKKYFKNRVHSIEILNHDESNKLFNTGNSIASLCIINLSDDPQVDLETYGFDKNEYELYKKINLNKDEIITFNACKGGPKNHKYGFIKTKNNPIQRFKYDVPVYTWHGGKNCYDAVIMSKDRQESKKGVSFVIIFNSETEVKNFKDSLKTKFMNWYYYNFVIPADNKIVNVMFRMKDYSKPWTDERFYKYFNINKEEQELIENYAEKIWNRLNEEILKKNDGKKFVTLCNPPYDKDSNGDQFYVKFINKILKISNKAIIISPDNAFLSKAKSKNKELKENINKYKPELEIGKWEGFDVHPNSNSCISIWNIINPNDKIKIGNKYFDKQEDIILNDNEYLEDFYNKLSLYIKNHKSIYDECVANPRNNNYFDPNGRRKVKEIWNNKNTWFTVFPYCVASHFSTFEYKQYSDELWKGAARILVPFDKEEYAKNCYLTIHKENGKRGELTDFYLLISKGLTAARYIQMVNQYKYFPYLDFSKIYTNEELFEMIGMKYNKEEIDKILNEK